MSQAQAYALERYREKLGPVSYAVEDRGGLLRIVIDGCLYRIDRDGDFYDGYRLSADDVRVLSVTAR